jgi:sugar (pentulose or hexulose) kinase
MSGDYIVVIDNGTQSVRALLFDLNGNPIARGRVPIEPYFSNQPGWAEQHPEYYWHSVCEAFQQLWAVMDTRNIPKTALAGVTLTTQRGTVINVDAKGKSLRPAIVWLDQRMTGGLKPVGGLWSVIFRAIGMTGTGSKIINLTFGNKPTSTSCSPVI